MRRRVEHVGEGMNGRRYSVKAASFRCSAVLLEESVGRWREGD